MRALVVASLLLAGCHDNTVSDEVGSGCRDGRDCVDVCERGGEFPGGFCTLSCLDDRDCTADSICADVDGGICLFECVTDGDCDLLGASYVCKERKDTADRQIFVCLGG